jgi:hypothetical protein
MHKILIRVYTEAVRELERASFFERDTPYTIFCLWVYQGLGKCYPPIWWSRRSIRREVLADIQPEGRDLEQLEPGSNPIS